MSEIGNNIRTRRLSIPATQKELEAESGIEQAHISKIENGVNVDPQYTTVTSLLKALDRLEARCGEPKAVA